VTPFQSISQTDNMPASYANTPSYILCQHSFSRKAKLVAQITEDVCLKRLCTDIGDLLSRAVLEDVMLH
jgi:hypothetical protein